MSLSIKQARMYQGDPGIFGFLGNVAKTIGGAALGVAEGLPVVGGAVRTGRQLLRGLGGPPSSAPMAPRYRPSGVPPMQKRSLPGIGRTGGGGLERATSWGRGRTNGRGVITLPGTGGTLPGGIAPGLQTPPPDASGRWRPNKTGYYVQAVPGQPEGGGIWVPPRSAWVRTRRRNPLNPRAIDRSISRIVSAKKATKKLSRITVREKCK